MMLFSVAVDRMTMSIDIAANTTITLDGYAVVDQPMREIVLTEIITKMAVEMANRVPAKAEMHMKAQAVNDGHTPDQLVHLMQVIASGRMGRDELSVLSERSPRFVKMLCDGLNVTMRGLRELVSEGGMTLDMMERAMR